MIENILELFKLLSFLFQVVDFSFIGVDGLVSVLNDKSLVFNLFFELLVCQLKTFDFILVLPLLFSVVLLLLFLLLNFLLCYWNITFCSQWCFCYILHLLRIFIFYFLKLLLFLLGNLSHCLLVLFLQSLNFPLSIVLLLSWSFYFIHMGLCHILKLSLV